MESPSRYSQCGRILRILEDGEWHSAREIFRRLPEGATLHSRIAELRKPGHGKWSYDIQHETRGPGAAGSFYRLAALSGEAHGKPGADAVQQPSRVRSSQRAVAFPESATLHREQGLPEPRSGGLADAASPALRGAPAPSVNTPGDPVAGAQLALELPARLREEAA